MKEINTAEVFPTLRNISLSRRTFVACAAIAAAQAALVSAGCAPEVQPSGEGLASTAAFVPGTYTASAPTSAIDRRPVKGVQHCEKNVYAPALCPSRPPPCPPLLRSRGQRFFCCYYYRLLRSAQHQGEIVYHV